MSQSRYWVFTEFNNDRVQNYEKWFSEVYGRDPGEVSYICGQQEQCPESSRVHIQGYIVCKTKRRLRGVKRILGSDTVHLEIRRGTHDEAVEYCRKSESRCGRHVFIGEYRDKRKSDNELSNIKKRIRDGDSLLDIADEHFGLWVRYNRAFEKYKSMVVKPRDFKTYVCVYYGRSGVGKSRRASFECGASAYRKPLGEWWDGYDGSANVIIDDYYGWIRFDELLRCLDRYPHRVPIKGGYVNFSPRLLIITSNVQPRQWYDVEKIDSFRFEALERRFDKVEEMIEDWTEPEQSPPGNTEPAELDQ